MNTNDHVASPCISVCTLRAGDEICTGCYRTLDEIATWGTMANDEKRRVLDQCDVRMEAMFDD
ncbi:MAG: DUF1289 domain-containing protein [Chromatiales bacterium]|jgi:uncharacterized protein|nr:DUF1289 domain-containing protein [Chromatiales bacterium]